MDITALRALAEQALADDAKLPGTPWCWNHVGDSLYREMPDGPPHYGSASVWSDEARDDGITSFQLFTWVAAARSREPALARAVLELIEENERLKQARDEHARWHMCMMRAEPERPLPPGASWKGLAVESSPASVRVATIVQALKNLPPLRHEDVDWDAHARLVKKAGGMPDPRFFGLGGGSAPESGT